MPFYSGIVWFTLPIRRTSFDKMFDLQLIPLFAIEFNGTLWYYQNQYESYRTNNNDGNNDKHDADKEDD